MSKKNNKKTVSKPQKKNSKKKLTTKKVSENKALEFATETHSGKEVKVFISAAEKEEAEIAKQREELWGKDGERKAGSKTTNLTDVINSIEVVVEENTPNASEEKRSLHNATFYVVQEWTDGELCVNINTHSFGQDELFWSLEDAEKELTKHETGTIWEVNTRQIKKLEKILKSVA